MNLGEPAARSLVSQLSGLLPFDRVDAVVAPAFPVLRAVLDVAAGTPLRVAAQNVHWEERGAFTGEVSAAMLVEMGVRLVLVGHSERRTLFGESDDAVARKVSAARRHGLVPIVCVGETLAEREEGRTESVLRRQLEGGLARLGPTLAGTVIAYEPVWAIGTGRTASPAQAQAAHAFLRGLLRGIAGEGAAAETRIQYGGSVNAANAAELFGLPDVDGGLIGGASLAADSFSSVVRAACAIVPRTRRCVPEGTRPLELRIALRNPSGLPVAGRIELTKLAGSVLS